MKPDLPSTVLIEDPSRLTDVAARIRASLRPWPNAQPSDFLLGTVEQRAKPRNLFLLISPKMGELCDCFKHSRARGRLPWQVKPLPDDEVPF